MAWLAGAAVVGGAWLAVYAGEAARAVPAAMGTQPGAVGLNPDSGPTSSTPTWSTTVACPSGFQGSATFKEVHADGATTNFISQIVNKTAAPFHGALQASIAQIQKMGGIPNGGTQELFVTCYSQYSGTGSARNEMDIYITYSASGSTYTTTSSGTGTSGGGTSSTPSPGGAGSGSLSGVSSSPPGGSLNPSPMSPTSPASVAPSPSPFDSSFAVTG